MTLDEAIKYAKRLMENNLWIFKDTRDDYHVIRLVDGNSTYNYYCDIWTPVININLKHEITYV